MKAKKGNKDAKDTAYDLVQALESACMDVAYSEASGIKAACLADSLYEDESFALDFLGDRLFDSVGRDSDFALEVIAILNSSLPRYSDGFWNQLRKSWK